MKKIILENLTEKKLVDFSCFARFRGSSTSQASVWHKKCVFLINLFLQGHRYRDRNIWRPITSAFLDFIWRRRTAVYCAKTVVGLARYRTAKSDVVSLVRVPNLRAITSAMRSTVKPSVLVTRVSVWTVTSATVSDITFYRTDTTFNSFVQSTLTTVPGSLNYFLLNPNQSCPTIDIFRYRSL